MERPLEKLSVTFIFLVGISYAILPEQVGAVLGPGIGLLTSGLEWANAVLPRPVFVILVLLAITVVFVLVALSFARVFYLVLSNAGPRAQYAYRKATPSTPIGKIAVFSFLAIGLLVGSVWLLPAVIGDIGEDQVSDVVNENGTETPTRETLDDAGHPGGDSAADAAAYERPTPDADGDRLRDEWERQGQLPSGVQIPNADPQRMDLYVQFNFGGGTLPLTAEEKQRLRDIWANMPVNNPDGSEGITLHIVDSRPEGGPLGQGARISDPESERIHEYYTEQQVGDRRCQYHQVVFGVVEETAVDGFADAPGYAAIVDGRQSAYGGDLTPRVRVITHALLHNVVGTVDGNIHTEQGWLSPGFNATDTTLSEPTAAQLTENGFAGSGHYQQDHCPAVGTMTGGGN